MSDQTLPNVWQVVDDAVAVALADYTARLCREDVTDGERLLLLLRYEVRLAAWRASVMAHAFRAVEPRLHPPAPPRDGRVTPVPVDAPPADDDERAQRMAEAGRLYDTLSAAGAQFDIDADGDLQTNLDGMPSITTHGEADAIARAVLALASEITAVLRQRAVVTH